MRKEVVETLRRHLLIDELRLPRLRNRRMPMTCIRNAEVSRATSPPIAPSDDADGLPGELAIAELPPLAALLLRTPLVNALRTVEHHRQHVLGDRGGRCRRGVRSKDRASVDECLKRRRIDAGTKRMKPPQALKAEIDRDDVPAQLLLLP